MSQDKEKLVKMGEACGCSPHDVETKLHKHGLTAATAEKAEMHGINLLTLLQLFNTYGPVFVNILNDILGRLKPVVPNPPADASKPA